jgi:type IV pilus assembly protein PilV
MKKRDDRGFTLVEMMAAATILGVGVMGMAAMQGISFTKNVDANDLSVVTNVASDMMERIQNNRRYAWAYNNLQTAGVGNCLAGGIPAPPPAAPFRADLPLSIATTRAVQGDCTQWRALVLATNLTNVQGVVQVVPPVVPIPNESRTVQVTVQLQWNDRGPTQRQRAIAFQTQIVPE